ncbi:MAG: sugar nucleotide-binding protein, partial [Alphaproteobacteria bacterium]|nr:sugar nucleotide-binding protein [Alphaproteobacteria bacterium]
MRDCLIVGGDSAIGRALAAELRARGLDVVSTSRRAGRGPDTVFLDLETLDGLGTLPPARHVALLAAETRFAVCAAEPERTHRINVGGPVAVSRRALVEWNARVLFFSSIAVHDGTSDRPGETERPTPNSLYGVQKLEAEDRLFGLGGKVAAIRPSKVVDDGFALFR